MGSEHSRIINNNNLDKKSENLLENNQKESVSTQSSVKTQNKAELKHPLPPSGLPTGVDYSQDNYLSKIRKNERKIQTGSGENEWIQKWTKIFNSAEEIDIYLHNHYYDIRSPVAYSSYSKLYPHIKRDGKYHITPSLNNFRKFETWRKAT